MQPCATCPNRAAGRNSCGRVTFGLVRRRHFFKMLRPVARRCAAGGSRRAQPELIPGKKKELFIFVQLGSLAIGYWLLAFDGSLTLDSQLLSLVPNI